ASGAIAGEEAYVPVPSRPARRIVLLTATPALLPSAGAPHAPPLPTRAARATETPRESDTHSLPPRVDHIARARAVRRRRNRRRRLETGCPAVGLRDARPAPEAGRGVCQALHRVDDRPQLRQPAGRPSAA